MEHPQPPDKKKATLWIIGCGAALAILAFLLCVAVILIAILVPTFSAATNQANNALAKSTLRNAVSAVEQYAAENNGLYTTMTADKLSSINTEIKWVDGEPGPGEVGIGDLGEATYMLTYKDSSGQKYTAERTDTGAIVYRDPVEPPLP